MAVLDNDINIAQYALVTVRYRSAEEAISFIMEPESGFYQHPFIRYCPKQTQMDLEMGPLKWICYLCQNEQKCHFSQDKVEEPDNS